MGLPLFFTTTIICPKIQPGFISYPQWIGIRQPWNQHIALSETHVGRLCNLSLLKSAMKGNGTAVIANPLRKWWFPHINFMRSTRLTCNFQLWFSREDFGVFMLQSPGDLNNLSHCGGFIYDVSTDLVEVEMLSWLAWAVRHVTRWPMHSINNWPPVLLAEFHGKAIGFG